MKKLSSLIVAGVILAAGPSFGQNQKAQKDQKTLEILDEDQKTNGPSPQATEEAKEDTEATRVTYNPPNRKTPGGRIGASTRGAMDRGLTVEVLAPDDHIGRSATAQPTLYYYLSQPVTLPLEVTIDTDELSGRSQPVLEVTLNQNRPAGIFPIDLRDYKARLAPEVVYRWSVAVVTNPEQRSSDLIASGLIQYVPPPPDFTKAAAQLRGDALMRSYAERGYWYDAIKTVSQGAGRQPDWRLQRAGLLDQVRLSGPAAWDRTAPMKQ
jgi:hypothetical protein